ncbi:MAG: hemolysin family protein [Longimicrobiales bacterium]
MAAIILVALAAFLTAALTAVLRLGDSRVRTLAEEGFSGAIALSELRADEVLTSPFAVLRILLLLTAVGAGFAAAVIGWGQSGLWAGGPLTVLGVLIFGDMIPRGLGSRRPVKLALTVAPMLQSGSTFAARLFFPFQWLERAFSRSKSDGETTTEEREVRETLEIGTEEGIVRADEHSLVERAFQLDELSAFDAMTPRVDILAWEDSRLLEDVIPEFEKTQFSRVPVYGESIDDITGILYIREAYQAYVSGQRGATLASLSRAPIFVPGSLSLDKLLKDFQTRRTHMGIVADEFGGTNGLITLEDVLEELVGEIVDETDTEEIEVTVVTSDEVIALGSADLREVNQVLNVALPVTEIRSLNGFILDELGTVPAPGTSLNASGLVIEVLDATETQVVRARLSRGSSTPQPEA